MQFEQSLCSSTMSFISNTVPLVPYRDNDNDDDDVDVDVGPSAHKLAAVSLNLP